MAMHCSKCGGIVPDLVIGGNPMDRMNCENHSHPEINVRRRPGL